MPAGFGHRLFEPLRRGHLAAAICRRIPRAAARLHMKSSSSSRPDSRSHRTGPADRPHVRRLRRRARLRTAAIVVLAISLSLADRAGWLLADRPDAEIYHLLTARVVRVFDGDTIEVDLPDHVVGTETTRVRVIGIDCPEAARPGPSPAAAEPWAAEATALTRETLAGGVVSLRLEPHQTRDAYRRLLAHVDLPDGSSLAERLLEQGLARREDRWNHSMLLRYRQLELAARRGGRGMWTTTP